MRDSFVFYRSFYEAIRDLPRDIQGEIYTAIMEYGLYGNETDNLKPIARSIFMLVKPIMDANNSRYENGCKGGRPKGGNNQTETKPKPKQNQTETKPKPNEDEDVDVDEDEDKKTLSLERAKKNAASGGEREEDFGVSSQKDKTANMCLSTEELIADIDGSDSTAANLIRRYGLDDELWRQIKGEIFDTWRFQEYTNTRQRGRAYFANLVRRKAEALRPEIKARGERRRDDERRREKSRQHDEHAAQSVTWEQYARLNGMEGKSIAEAIAEAVNGSGK